MMEARLAGCFFPVADDGLFSSGLADGVLLVRSCEWDASQLLLQGDLSVVVLL